MGLIDADELIKCIPSEEYNSRFAVMNAPTVDPYKWIPCSEDSPKSSDEYLVTVKWPSDEYSIDVYEYNASHKEWNDGESFCGERVVAWMPCPEPYKGGQ